MKKHTGMKKRGWGWFLSSPVCRSICVTSLQEVKGCLDLWPYGVSLYELLLHFKMYNITTSHYITIQDRWYLGKLWISFAHIFVCVPQETGKDAYIKDLPNHLSKFEAVLQKNKSGFLVGDSVRHFYRMFKVAFLHVHSTVYILLVLWIIWCI